MILYHNHFCLVWKSQGVSFNQAIEELINNFKIVDNYISEENFKSVFECKYIPKKIESHLTNFITYDLETHNTDRARPYVFCFYRLSKLAGRHNRDLNPAEIQKCRIDTIAFDGYDCVSKALDFCIKVKGEERKVKNKIVECNLQLHAHNGSGFDTWIVLNNLDCDKRIVIIIKNGKSIIEMKVFHGYFEKNTKQNPQYLHFCCGMTHLNYSLKKLRRTFKLQKEILKIEMDHDEIDGNNYRRKINEWLPYVKNDVLCTAFSYARYCKAIQEITGFSMKDCLSVPGLGLKYINSLRTDQD